MTAATYAPSPGGRLSTRMRLAAIWSRRGVLGQLVSRDIRIRYSNSVLGYFWTLLEPLMLTALYYIVFTLLLGRARFGIRSYALFLIVGVLPWQWVSSVITASMRSLRGQARLITKVRIPREIFPLAVVGAKGFEFFVSWLIIALIAAVSRVGVTGNIVYVPLAVLLQTMLLVGLALFMSSVNVMLRDLERIIRIVLRFLFYMSGVIFPVAVVLESDRLPEWGKILFQSNPLLGLFALYRSVFYPDAFPTRVSLTATIVGSFATLAIGYWTFTRLERSVLKEL